MGLDTMPVMARYQLVIFDFDGTLADSADWTMRTFNDVAEQFGLRRISDAELQMLRGRSNREIVQYLGVPMWKVPGIVREMRERISADVERIPLFPGVTDVLRNARNHGVHTAIVSSNSESNVRRILGAENVILIQHFACGAAIFGKARKLRAVMERFRVSAAHTLCVGDETRDIEAAREVGADSGAVLWGYATAAVLRRFEPTHLFASMAELAAFHCENAIAAQPG